MISTPIFDQVKKDHEEARGRARQAAVDELETLTKPQLLVRIGTLSTKVGIATKTNHRMTRQSLLNVALDLTHLAFGPAYIEGV